MPIFYILLGPFSSVAHKQTLPLFVRARNGTALAKRRYRSPLTIPLQYRDASIVLTPSSPQNPKKLPTGLPATSDSKVAHTI